MTVQSSTALNPDTWTPCHSANSQGFMGGVGQLGIYIRNTGVGSFTGIRFRGMRANGKWEVIASRKEDYLDISGGKPGLQAVQGAQVFLPGETVFDLDANQGAYFTVDSSPFYYVEVSAMGAAGTIALVQLTGSGLTGSWTGAVNGFADFLQWGDANSAYALPYVVCMAESVLVPPDGTMAANGQFTMQTAVAQCAAGFTGFVLLPVTTIVQAPWWASKWAAGTYCLFYYTAISTTVLQIKQLAVAPSGINDRMPIWANELSGNSPYAALADAVGVAGAVTMGKGVSLPVYTGRVDALQIMKGGVARIDLSIQCNNSANAKAVSVTSAGYTMAAANVTTSVNAGLSALMYRRPAGTFVTTGFNTGNRTVTGVSWAMGLDIPIIANLPVADAGAAFILVDSFAMTFIPTKQF